MKLQLMAAVPCKRFDFSPSCEDGRGGWTFCQFGADRYVADGSLLAIKLGLAVWVEPGIREDYVESSILTVKNGEITIGTDTMDWKQPNQGGARHEVGNVYEWIQDVNAPVERDGLLTISVALKLRSQLKPMNVDGSALVHITCRDTNHQLVSPDEYSAAMNDENRSWSF